VTKRVTIEWPDLNISVSATLLEEKNPELCDVFWSHLPFESVQEHTVVSGKGTYCWAPIVTTAPARHTERSTETPVGRLQYIGATGNKIGLVYGPITEPLEHAIPIGQVVEDDLEKLKVVGRAVWDSTFYTKKIIMVHFMKAPGT
jgi:hypothetical protein